MFALPRQLRCIGFSRRLNGRSSQTACGRGVDGLAGAAGGRVAATSSVLEEVWDPESSLIRGSADSSWQTCPVARSVGSGF